MVYFKTKNALKTVFNYRNSIHGAAICAFNLSAINAAFSGPFKHQETPSSFWEGKDLEHRNQFECKFNSIPSTRSDYLMGSHRFQLMNDAVQPIKLKPLFTSNLERFTHIALDAVTTKLLNKVLVIYAATDKNLIKKISVLTEEMKTCVIETWQPAIKEHSKILTLQFLKHTESLYVGTENSVIRIAAQHCKRHISRENCLNSMDPYCGWNDLQQACTPPPDGDTLKRFWIQQANDCPISTTSIDGGFSAWSNWFQCQQHMDDRSVDMTNHDSCLCRTRTCNNPIPRNGGLPCKGTLYDCTFFFIFD